MKIKDAIVNLNNEQVSDDFTNQVLNKIEVEELIKIPALISKKQWIYIVSYFVITFVLSIKNH